MKEKWSHLVNLVRHIARNTEPPVKIELNYKGLLITLREASRKLEIERYWSVRNYYKKKKKKEERNK